MSPADPSNSSILEIASVDVATSDPWLGRRMTVSFVPRLGVGSRSWAGNENLTEAISDTPMNLWGNCEQL